jgi:hypothetical protein
MLFTPLSISSSLLFRRVRFSAAVVRQQAVMATDEVAAPDAFPHQAVAASSASHRAKELQRHP